MMIYWHCKEVKLMKTYSTVVSGKEMIKFI
jgi:hypothetical protein